MLEYSVLGLGEWHMHCHIPMHMMSGMMGSLLVVNGGTSIKGLLSAICVDNKFSASNNN
jgi:hypothetical protein